MRVLTVLTALMSACLFEPSGSHCHPDLTGLPDSVSGAFALVGVDVVPMSDNRVLRDQTVIVRDGTIQRVGPRSAVVVEAGIPVIEPGCGYLIPGLADMHTHIGWFSELLLYVSNGVTTVRNMWGFEGHVTLRDEIAAGRFGPTMYVSGPGVDGEPPFWPGTELLVDPADADEIVERHQMAGYDFIKVYESLTIPAYDALTAAAEARGMPYAGHVPVRVQLDRVLASQQRTIEHLSHYFEPLGANSWTGSIDRGAMPGVAQSVVASGVWSVPTSTVWRKLFSTEERQAFLRSDHARFVTPGQIDGWTNRYRPMNPDARRAGIENRGRMIEEMHSQGARMLAGTDAGFTDVIAGFTIHDELEMFVDGGLTPYDALITATVAPAEFLGVSAGSGRVAEGMRADLVLLTDNPLHDISATRQRSGVVVRGVWYSWPELQRRLEELAASFQTDPSFGRIADLPIPPSHLTAAR